MTLIVIISLRSTTTLLSKHVNRLKRLMCATENLGVKQHSNNRSLMILVLYFISTNFGRNLTENFRNITLLIDCSVYINSSTQIKHSE